MPALEVTRHAHKRLRKRVGLPKSAVQNNARKALLYGVTHAETTGGLHRYLDYLWHQHETANNVRVYCGSVYIFCGDTLVTVWPLPEKFRKRAQDLAKKKGGQENA